MEGVAANRVLPYGNLAGGGKVRTHPNAKILYAWSPVSSILLAILHHYTLSRRLAISDDRLETQDKIFPAIIRVEPEHTFLRRCAN